MLQRHPAVLNLTGMALLPRGSRRRRAFTTLVGIVLCTACANGGESPGPGASGPRAPRLDGPPPVPLTS